MGRILITGAGARIGQLLAIALAEAGHHIIVHYRSSEKGATETLRQIESIGGSGELIQADLESHEQCTSLLPKIATNTGPVQGLINNASQFENDHLDDMTSDDWDRHFAINAKAPVFLTQGFAAQLPADQFGHVINLLDQRLSRPHPAFFSYTLSKAALSAATSTMAQALAPRIQVNAVAPGPTLQGARQSEADFAAQQSQSLLEYGSPPAEIIKAVQYLLQAKAITGQTLIVDGGQHLAWQHNTGAKISE
ncbi:MAG: short chain dehydrogenase [Robiginitomaculum sp.]|nr:MAG: short chain dehydrogenase [Robiginitomaculum sp.]